MSEELNFITIPTIDNTLFVGDVLSLTLESLSAFDTALFELSSNMVIPDEEGKLSASQFPEHLDTRLVVLAASSEALDDADVSDNELVINLETQKVGFGFLGDVKYSNGALKNTSMTLLVDASDNLKGYGLTAIPDNWQNLDTSLKALAIGNTVTSIGNYAFQGCGGFTGSLIIPDSVASIGNYAFGFCAFTGSLVIPDSVTTIEFGSFSNWSGLNTLTLPKNLTSIGNYAFYNSGGFTGSLKIPDSVTTIGDWAFQSCGGFTGSLTIPDSVTSIGNYVFQGCFGFTGSLIIPDSVTSIGNYAFGFCAFTGSLVIPDSVTSIGSYAFQSCSNLGNVYANLDAANFPSNALDGAGTGNLYITTTHIASYGGVAASWGSKTVAEWTSYPDLMP
jgi:BspA type Leucine rich repeat region (6 copies)